MKPAFLGIGAPRSGTSWLYVNLRQHPDVWLTPIKELHYFDTRELPVFKNQYLRHNLYQRLRQYAYGVLRNRNRLRSLPWKWDFDFFFRRRSTQWYASLFRPAAGQIAGEITPTYMTLNLSVVEEIGRLNPDLKVIFLMRNPIDRAWSSAVKDLARKKQRSLDTIPEREFFEHFERQQLQLRSDYLRTLNNWTNVFGPAQVFTSFFEEVQKDPRGLLLRVHRFLGISSSPDNLPERIHDKVNSTESYNTGIPLKFQSHLARQCMPQLEELARHFDEPVSGWLRHAREVQK